MPTHELWFLSVFAGYGLGKTFDVIRDTHGYRWAWVFLLVVAIYAITTLL